MSDAGSGSARQGRPSLASTTRSSSFLREHQQYRPPTKPENHYGIDTVVEDLQASTIAPAVREISPFRGIPSPEHPPKIVESGVSHELSHPNCTPVPGAATADRLVATLFYKTTAPRISNAIPSPKRAISPQRPRSPKPDSELPPTMSPSSSLDTFPLEPPAAEPEPLDHLYGSYVSPMCITSFLHLMSTFPLPPGSTDLYSAHRCLKLDDAGPDHHPVVVELTLSPAPSADYLPLADLRNHELIYRFEREWNVDVALRADTLWRRYPRLVVFDMDSTLITQEVIDLLAATIKDPPDLAARVADITHRAMLGELEFDSAFRERVKLLTGLPVSIFEELRPVLDVTQGVRPLLKALKRLGIKTAVLSGGFLPLTSWLAGELGLDHAHANEVVVDEATGRLTGEVKGRIVGAERKRELLIEIAEKEGVPLEQTVAVGDGANDLLMMGVAGLGVAWNAKPRVQMEATARLNGSTLLDLLHLFGFTEDEVRKLTA